MYRLPCVGGLCEVVSGVLLPLSYFLLLLHEIAPRLWPVSDLPRCCPACVALKLLKETDG